jgi:hypothetical protein
MPTTGAVITGNISRLLNWTRKNRGAYIERGHFRGR